jgi:uncharacterized protein with GYD domain
VAAAAGLRARLKIKDKTVPGLRAGFKHPLQRRNLAQVLDDVFGEVDQQIGDGNLVAKEIQDTVSRARNAEKLLQSMGGRKIGVWWTLGQYDLVYIAEAPNDETMVKFLAALAKLGNVRTSTMRCFSEEEAAQIFGG